MTEHLHPEYAIVFPNQQDEMLLLQAVDLIASYAAEGLMIMVDIDQLMKMAAAGLLALAVTPQDEVVGTAGITYLWEDKTNPGEIWHEFGGWAVKEAYKKHGVGKHLLTSLLEHHGKLKHIFALGNHNSSPIMQKMGGKLLDHNVLPPAVWDPCKTCLCPLKDKLPSHKKCVDDAVDLKPIVEKKDNV